MQASNYSHYAGFQEFCMVAVLFMIFYLAFILAAFDRINSKDYHKCQKTVLSIGHIDQVSICKMKKLLFNPSHNAACLGKNAVIPFQEAAFHMPAIAVNGKRGLEKSKLLGDGSHRLSADLDGKPGQEGQHLLPKVAT